jgi:hypothetical protein
LFALGVTLGYQFLVQNHLADAAAVAYVEEDEVAVVAAPVDPAHEHYLLTGVGGTQFAAEMGAFKFA